MTCSMSNATGCLRWATAIHASAGAGRHASVVYRFLTSGVLLIITAYVHEEDEL